MCLFSLLENSPLFEENTVEGTDSFFSIYDILLNILVCNIALFERACPQSQSIVTIIYNPWSRHGTYIRWLISTGFACVKENSSHLKICDCRLMP